MTEFDLILGMDWLHKYEALIDCYQYSMTFCTNDGQRIKFRGERSVKQKTSSLTALLTGV